MKITMPVEVMMQEVERLLKMGGETTFRAKGRSMMPYVRDGKDDLVVRGVDPATLKIGDFILVRTTDNRYVAHRIIAIAPDLFTLKGDGNMRGTETCTPDHVLGLVTHIIRNGKRIDCNTPAERRKAAIGRKFYHAYLWSRHAAGTVLRRLHILPSQRR